MNIPSEALPVPRCDADLASGLAVSPPASLTLRHHQYTVQYSHVRAIFLRYTILRLKNDPTLKRYSSKLLADPTVLTVAHSRYATVLLRLYVTLCIVAIQCVLVQKLLLTAHRKSCIKN